MIIVWLLYVSYLIQKQWFIWLQTKFIYKIPYAREKKKVQRIKETVGFSIMFLYRFDTVAREKEKMGLEISFTKFVFKLLALPSA